MLVKCMERARKAKVDAVRLRSRVWNLGIESRQNRTPLEGTRDDRTPHASGTGVFGVLAEHYITKLVSEREGFKKERDGSTDRSRTATSVNGGFVSLLALL